MTTVSTTATEPIRVEIWSDVVCPWCYIGKRRFERAVDELEGEIEVEAVYRAYQLDPTASPGRSEPVFDAYVRKFGGPDQARVLIDRVTDAAAGDGLEFRLDRALRANSLLAHRLLWRSEQPESPVAQVDLKERLLQAYFIDGLDIGDPDVLADCAAEVGLDRDATREFLDSDRGRAEVAEQLARAAELDITGVPTFVIDGQWAVPGAQDSDTFVQVLRRLAERRAAEAVADSGVSDRAAACEGDGCET